MNEDKRDQKRPTNPTTSSNVPLKKDGKQLPKIGQGTASEIRQDLVSQALEHVNEELLEHYVAEEFVFGDAKDVEDEDDSGSSPRTLDKLVGTQRSPGLDADQAVRSQGIKNSLISNQRKTQGSARQQYLGGQKKSTGDNWLSALKETEKKPEYMLPSDQAELQANAPRASKATGSDRSSAPEIKAGAAKPIASPQAKSMSPTPATPKSLPTSGPVSSPKSLPTSGPGLPPKSLPTSGPALPPKSLPTLGPVDSTSKSQQTSGPVTAPSKSQPTLGPATSPSKGQPTSGPATAPSKSQPTLGPATSPSKSQPTSGPATSPSKSQPPSGPATSPSKSLKSGQPTAGPVNTQGKISTPAPAAAAQEKGKLLRPEEKTSKEADQSKSVKDKAKSETDAKRDPLKDTKIAEPAAPTDSWLDPILELPTPLDQVPSQTNSVETGATTLEAKTTGKTRDTEAASPPVVEPATSQLDAPRAPAVTESVKSEAAPPAVIAPLKSESEVSLAPAIIEPPELGVSASAIIGQANFESKTWSAPAIIEPSKSESEALTAPAVDQPQPQEKAFAPFLDPIFAALDWSTPEPEPTVPIERDVPLDLKFGPTYDPLAPTPDPALDEASAPIIAHFRETPTEAINADPNSSTRLSNPFSNLMELGKARPAGPGVEQPETKPIAAPFVSEGLEKAPPLAPSLEQIGKEPVAAPFISEGLEKTQPLAPGFEQTEKKLAAPFISEGLERTQPLVVPSPDQTGNRANAAPFISEALEKTGPLDLAAASDQLDKTRPLAPAVPGPPVPAELARTQMFSIPPVPEELARTQMFSIPPVPEELARTQILPIPPAPEELARTQILPIPPAPEELARTQKSPIPPAPEELARTQILPIPSVPEEIARTQMLPIPQAPEEPARTQMPPIPPVPHELARTQMLPIPQMPEPRRQNVAKTLFEAPVFVDDEQDSLTNISSSSSSPSDVAMPSDAAVNSVDSPSIPKEPAAQSLSIEALASSPTAIPNVVPPPPQQPNTPNTHLSTQLRAFFAQSQ